MTDKPPRPPITLTMLSTADKLAEIRRLYFTTTRERIQNDLARALDLLKSMPSEEDRERATVYMEGLAQMRKDWGLAGSGTRKPGQPRRGPKPPKPTKLRKAGNPGKRR
jgi:hypothetical protein